MATLAFLTRDVQAGADGALPTEFRLFVAGVNHTENGDYLFDEQAAAQVMAAYRAWGVDLAIDLEHQMLGDPASDPTARDARGWCKLEVRPDGSLWAVDVRWTPDGAARLAEKRQRYVSPAFNVEPKTQRVSKILNVAITAMPATHQTPALVAASVTTKEGGSMDPALVKKALDAVESGDSAAALEILKGLIASAAGAEITEDEGDASQGDAAQGAPDPSADAAAAAVPPPAAKDGSADAPDSEDMPAKKAARVQLQRLTGTSSLTDALAQVAIYRASHIELEGERQKLAAERAALEGAERRKLCVELVTLGAEFPATIWADPTAAKPSKLKARWESMPIAELREHVSEQRTARGGKRAADPKVPAGEEAGGKTFETSHGTVTLSARELATCAEVKADPAVYAQNKAIRDAARRA